MRWITKIWSDLDLPGIAVVAHPPVFGGKVKSVNDAEARRVEGVRDVFEIPLVKGSGVAVVADKFWPAKQARDLLKIDWDLSGIELPDSAQLWTSIASWRARAGTWRSRAAMKS
jgi:isoquinoline 1-oxidoreductase beta subunit